MTYYAGVHQFRQNATRMWAIVRAGSKHVTPYRALWTVTCVDRNEIVLSERHAAPPTVRMDYSSY